MRPRGFTVLETVVAMFILITAAVISAQMLGLAMRASASARDQALALAIAQRKVREIVAWSREPAPGGLNFGQRWPDGTDGNPPPAPPFAASPDADNPRFVVEARGQACTVQSPGGGLPSVGLNGSLRLVKVVVTWGTSAGAPRARSVAIVGSVAEPARRITEIRLTGPAALAPGEHATYSAEARDADGPIPDLVMRWEVVPVDGNASVSADVASGTATVTNAVRMPNGHRYSTGGRCRLRVTASCDGAVQRAEQPIELGEAVGPLGGP